jgi:glycine oxidase
MYRSFAEELTEASGIDVEYKDDGTLFVVVEGEDDDAKTKWAAWQLDAGLSLEHVSAADLRRLEPAVTELATRAIFLPDEHQVENRRLMEALEAAIKHAGVELIEGADVSALTFERGRVTGVVSAGKRFDAGVVIVAAGTWSSRLLEPLGLNVKVIPARGQMIAVRGNGCPIKRVLHSSKVYIVPRNDGRILIGATVEYAGFNKAVTAGAINQLLNAAVELIPSIANFEMVETWCGLRPDTIDHLPIIGPSGVDNLVLASGHFRNGILLAPITAKFVAELTNSNRQPDALRPFGIDRFDNRQERAPVASHSH